MSQKRFSFDDDFENTSNVSVFQGQDSLNDRSVTANSKNGKNKMKKKKKGKFKIKKWQIALIIFLLLIIIFIVYVFVAGSNEGPVYGDRCASLIAIDETKFDGIEDTIEADGNINSVNIEVDCRIIKISMDFIDNTTSDTAIQLATNVGTANGRGQYNVEFVLTSNGDSNFPMFGTKHPSSDEITFTGANVVDQAATDRANSTLNQSGQ